MLWTIIRNSFVLQKKALAVMLLSATVGTALAASLITLSLDISSKVTRELRSFGANIIVRPKATGLAGLSGQRRYLRQEDLVRSKTIFWRHNIVGLAPVLFERDEQSGIQVMGTWFRHELSVPGEKKPFTTGMYSVKPWWEVEGAWPGTEGELLAGAAIAKSRGYAPGDTVTLFGEDFRISGILTSGGKEDEMLVGELETIQKLTSQEGRLSQVLVSALTTPMDDFAYRDPNTMTRKEYEKWYCTGYVTSIARQLETEAFQGAIAGPVWPVAEAEGHILNRLQVLIWMLAFLSLGAAVLSVSTTMITSILRRTGEVALMKALGSGTFQTIILFLTELLMIGTGGGLAGYFLSLAISDFLGKAVFGTGLEQREMLFLISMGVSVAITVVAGYLPIRRALGIKPAVILKGGS